MRLVRFIVAGYLFLAATEIAALTLLFGLFELREWIRDKWQ